MPTQIAIAVVEHEGHFLIGQRPSGVPLAGLWEFPGGKMKPGEMPEAAAVRECLEETGLVVEPLLRYPTHVEQYDHDRVELQFIACRPIEGSSGLPREPFLWVPRVELSKYEFPQGNRELLRILSEPQIALGESARLR
jgi:8-oxo-dGTP diphosphatase